MNHFLTKIKSIFSGLDWIMIISLVPILLAGLFTMNSFSGDNDFFFRQLFWIGFSFVVFIICANIDFKFLRRTEVVVWLFAVAVGLLTLLFIFGSVFKGAKGWFNFGFFAFQPAEFAKFILIIVLAKYFSRRHIEIRNIRHILVSGFYAFVFFFLILLQPDFGSAIIVFSIWLGMVLLSGISKKHLFIVFAVGLIAFVFLWFGVFKDYQKNRLLNFVNPMHDIRGTGYNAYQSMITVGSGQLLGRGLGYGTQSRLKFLPEYQTDFIFAAFAEEWGFLGVLVLFMFYGIVIWRIIDNAWHGATNFEILYGLGLAMLFVAHFAVHVGMNIGVLPVTGLTLPFMSYGGSHLLISFFALGVLMSMRRYARTAHKDVMKNEFLGGM